MFYVILNSSVYFRWYALDLLKYYFTGLGYGTRTTSKCFRSILKSKLGEGFNVYEQPLESLYPLNLEEYQISDKEFYLWKLPILKFPENSPTNFLIKNGLV